MPLVADAPTWYIGKFILRFLLYLHLPLFPALFLKLQTVGG
jgi:hypothetical protein